jgi:AcrR family transcriptional regulator
MVRARRRKPQRESQHPTRELLLRTTVTLLDGFAPEQITSEQVLSESGVSRGSLYHHFEDFPDLVASAQVARFAAFVDQSIAALTGALETATDRDSLLAGLRAVTEATQSPERAGFRMERVGALAATGSDERMRRMLGAEQARLTDALTELILRAQQRGLYRQDFDARAGAVLIQAYTLGRIIDDIVDEPVDPAAWNELITKVISQVFAAPG